MGVELTPGAPVWTRGEGRTAGRYSRHVGSGKGPGHSVGRIQDPGTMWIVSKGAPWDLETEKLAMVSEGLSV